MKKIIAFCIAICLLSITACKRTGDEEHTLITDRIQYDVFIKSPDPGFDWWMQNIEGQQREKLVKMIFDAAFTGKVKTYDYYNNPLTAEDVYNMCNKTDTFTIQETSPPYDFRDTVVKSEIRLNDVVKLRFLEEWSINKKTLDIYKKVAGIAPIIENFDPEGNFRGYTPLFWIYLDSKYPDEFSALK